jgi:hypothetical protein
MVDCPEGAQLEALRKRRRGGGRARIAPARKFLGVSYYACKPIILVFEDFHNFIPAF